MEEAPIQRLADALQVFEQLIVGVRPEQWTEPTPCSEWMVRDLVAHVLAGNRVFVGALGGGAPGVSGVGGADTLVPAELLSGYRTLVGPLLEAFTAPGVLQRMVTVPFGTVPGVVALHLRIIEVLTHGWDLAHATGQDAGFADEEVESELAFTRAKLAEIPPGRSPFAPPHPVADDAPALDRLAGLLGRRVTPSRWAI